ncbi:MAG: lytic transglycosylase domain-containing protein [Acidobacteriota bacterium]
MRPRRARTLVVVSAVAGLAFLFGSARHDPAGPGTALLGTDVSTPDRIASLRMRVAAIERENENLRTQLWVRTSLERAPLNLDPDQMDRVMASLLEAHHRYSIPTEVLLAVIKAESDFDVDAVSAAGAVGLMQIMPATGRAVAKDLNIPWTGKKMLRDPVINIQLGSEYLHRMFRRFGHADNALAAYNAGPTRVEAMNNAGILPGKYAGRVRQSLKQFDR